MVLPVLQEINEQLTEMGHLHDTLKGYVASFFAPRVDMNFITHTQETKNKHGSIMDVERFIARKM